MKNNAWIYALAPVLVAAFASGCASTTPAKVPAIPDALDVKETVRVDARLLVDCLPTLGKLKPNPQPLEVLEQHSADVEQYTACREQNASLIRTVKKAFNIE